MSVVIRNTSGSLGPGTVTVTMRLRNGLAMVLPPSSLADVCDLATALEDELTDGAPTSALVVGHVALDIADIAVFSVEIAGRTANS